MSAAGATRRLFFALWPDLPWRQRLLNAAAPLLSTCAPAERVAASDLHVTLAFLGAVPETALPALKWQAAAIDATGCILRFDHFEYWRAAQVLCAVANEVPVAAQRLLQRLRAAAAAASATASADMSAPAVELATDAKSFRPHVTLARHLKPTPLSFPALAMDFSASEFTLVESRRDGERRYRVLDSWPLR